MAVYLQYIPIYFQTVRGTSAINSGIRMMVMDAGHGRIIFIIISGIIVTKFGYYMPYMVIGTMINVVAAGLLTTLDLDTSTAHSTAFMFLAGAGAGIGGNQPFTALQAALKSLAFAISQPVFLTKIFSRLSSDPLTSNISRSSIIAAGGSHLNQLVDNPAALKVVRKAYSEGIRDTMMVALVAICLCLLCPPGMEWLKLESPDAKTEEDIENIQSVALTPIAAQKESWIFA
ncbi:hypothetical protein DID88_001998 [Monilinia fructigena]|uniref:Major facilitator superfamily (MFS) profile domain-containing protein n=1 Tax=Monilinia fructigena TaxID=38457 RepID=A0A395IXC5_9HELO|nr:hypothetical protein DID88_001998 [Monilinia fructigena]